MTDPTDPTETFVRPEHPEATPDLRERQELRNRLSTLVRNPGAYTLVQLQDFEKLGKANLERARGPR